jgi:uncharacterized protein YbjT (DUF2867 family)
MTNKDGLVLVAGATGRQGGAVARHLRTKGWKLRALTRNPDSYAARQLAERGIELVQRSRRWRIAGAGGARRLWSLQRSGFLDRRRQAGGAAGQKPG